MATELATAYVQIVPSADGISSKLKTLLNDELESAGTSGGETWGSSFKSAVSSAVTSVATVVTDALSVAVQGIATLTKEAVSAYAEYEQLVGGVETLYGDAADAVMEYANNAFKTAGLSANDYMETVTSFAASLVSGLGGDTAQAAEIANIAITDMADNANKMGTSIESIQAAYQGLAKQNYTMLDNLKLGYAGTQAGMIALINDSGILEETISSLDDVSLDQMILAIHAVQEQLGITGTTAEEAESTIQGSLSSLSASWTNFLTGMADESQDFDTLLGNLVDSAITFAGNIVPRLAVALPRLVEGLSSLIGELAPYMPDIIGELIPALLSAVHNLFALLIECTPTLINTFAKIVSNSKGSIWTKLKTYATLFGNLVREIGSTLLELMPDVISGVVDFLAENGPGILAAGLEMLENIVAAIPGVIVDLGDNLPDIIDTILEALDGAVPMILESAVNMLTNIIKAIPSVVTSLSSAMKTINDRILTSIASWGAQILAAAGKVLLNIVSPITDTMIPKVKTALANFMAAIVSGITSKVSSVTTAIGKVVSTVTSTITSLVSKATTWGKDMLDNFINGIKNKISALTSTVTGIASKIKSLLGFSVPEDGPLSNADTYMPDFMDLLSEGINENYQEVVDEAESLAGAINEAMAFDADDLNATVTYNSDNLDRTTGETTTADSTNQKMLDLLQAVKDSIDGLDLSVSLDGEAISNNTNKRLGKKAAATARGN